MKIFIILTMIITMQNFEMKEREYVRINEHLTVAQFEQIKGVILEKGDRGIFRNIDSNNPYCRVKDFVIYLGPSSRRNIQCDPAKSDFNELVVYDSGKEIQYYHIKIVRVGDKTDSEIVVPAELEENNVYLVNIYGDDSAAFKANFFENYLPGIKQLIR